MDYDADGLRRVREVADESNFPGRHAGCVLHMYDDNGEERWVGATNMVAVCEADPLDKKYGVSAQDRPYEWTPHAEPAAIAEAASMGLSTCGATAYLRGSPCIECAVLLARAGVDLVVICNDDEFQDDEGWNVNAGIDFLKEWGTNVVREC